VERHIASTKVFLPAALILSLAKSWKRAAPRILKSENAGVKTAKRHQDFSGLRIGEALDKNPLRALARKIPSRKQCRSVHRFARS
jgi:hypothetical protein